MIASGYFNFCRISWTLCKKPFIINKPIICYSIDGYLHIFSLCRNCDFPVWENNFCGTFKRTGSFTCNTSHNFQLLSEWYGLPEFGFQFQGHTPYMFTPVSYTHLTLPTNREV